MPCIECHSSQTTLERREDGHYHKHCDDCGHDWGPFVSDSDGSEAVSSSGGSGSSGQSGLDDW